MVYRNFFTAVENDEARAVPYPGEPPLGPIYTYPSFGDSTSSYDADVHGNLAIKKFYRAWQNFVSRKTFAANDVYNTNMAPDRRIRRFAQPTIRHFDCSWLNSFAGLWKKRINARGTKLGEYIKKPSG